MGRWFWAAPSMSAAGAREAAEFLETNEAALAQRPVWLFSSGPTGDGEPEEKLDGWRFPTKLQPIADRIKPRDIVLFHGELDEDELNFLEKWTIKMVKAPTGDFRDWEAIDRWASEIAAALKELSTAVNVAR
ncbi:MAG: hypothetical protein HC802_02890 [Caldilineaceae bacterium]|nr:hypothetical protein [Caldilineaceae bacterium]